MISGLRALARTHGDREAVLVLPDRGDELDRITYGALDLDARRIAAALQRRLEPGARVVLAYPTGIEFVRAFLGCLYAGVVPVPAPLPLSPRSGKQLTRLRGIIASCRAALILAPDGYTELLSETGIPASTAPRGRAEDWTPRAERPEEIAFLQFTSGSVGDPRGVVVTYGALAANTDLIHRHYALPDGFHVGSWLPLYHDMGLIGAVLLPLRFGGRATLLSPTAFLLDPYRWLHMIDVHDVFISPAPNFAYDLCVRRIPASKAAGLDLSRWRAALNGAEPVRAATLAAFADCFAAAGFRPESFSPCYGMAEVGLFVTGTPNDEPPVVSRISAEALEQGAFVPDAAGVPMVSSGPVPDHYRLTIADPGTGEPVDEGRVGEIRLSGPSVAPGYWGQPVFGPELRTGDLGTVHDGQLYLTGRLKELIIIRGRNFYPQDLEYLLGQVDSSFEGGLAAAFSVPAQDEEHIVVVQEVRTDHGDLDGLALKAKAALAELATVTIAGVCLVPPGAIRRSTSGKIRRLHMRKLFRDNTLNATHEELDPVLRRTYRKAPS
ncbi:fatty acyl-AMP ligase [Nocardia puris]|uniref:fatty acyl-AMP ligase n=1 Tax=Nocardia puris TaxID=208602 RepID=UPI001892E0F0|nr:fatty acyl-AMP ligase [Nocardia puris]MBF6215160.1 fatty acyl-AMP ligase [Nocardia puris]